MSTEVLGATEEEVRAPTGRRRGAAVIRARSSSIRARTETPFGIGIASIGDDAANTVTIAEGEVAQWEQEGSPKEVDQIAKAGAGGVVEQECTRKPRRLW